MLMKTRGYVDFCHVPDDQQEMDRRLKNWARWVRVRPHGWQTHAMWRHAKTSRQWDVDPHVFVPPDTLDAVLIEKTVSWLPKRWRDAVRWSYVHQGDPANMARRLAVSKQDLALLVSDGRLMLANRLGQFSAEH